MTADLALQWMSESGAGRLRDLRERLEWLARTAGGGSWTDTGRWLRNVSALGHAEIDWAGDRWAVLPPALVRLPACDGLAVLVGARRKRTLTALEETDLALHEVPPPASAAGLPSPTAILCQFDSLGDLQEAARSAGVAYAGCVAQLLAPELPRAGLGSQAAPPAQSNDTLQRRSGPGPQEWEPFGSTAASAQDGLYRMKINGRQEYRTVRSGAWYRCDLSSGVFLELARQGISSMRWRPEDGLGRRETGTFFLDWGAALPPLHARTLTLCSGQVPRFSEAATTASYQNVPRDIARHVARTLLQSLMEDR